MSRRAYKQLIAEITCNMWSVTPYSLCDYRCLYCCTNAQGDSVPVMSADEALEVMRHAMETLPREHRLFILGAYSDAYPWVEAKHGITRRVVEELVRARVRFTIVTKGMIVLRDADLLRTVPELCNVQVSISSTNDALLKAMEPNAPSGSARFELVENLAELGVSVDVNALPWIPGVTDTEEIIRRVPKHVPITFSPLATGIDRDSRVILGRRYHRQEVWDRYLEEYRRFGHHANTSWVRPCPPPHENHPMYRLPVLPMSDAQSEHARGESAADLNLFWRGVEMEAS